MLSLILAAALLSDPVATPVVLPSEPSPLHGTLLAPSGTRAAAVILPGSGPTDRDGNSALGISASSYRLLAEGLAAHRRITRGDSGAFTRVRPERSKGKGGAGQFPYGMDLE